MFWQKTKPRTEETGMFLPKKNKSGRNFVNKISTFKIKVVVHFDFVLDKNAFLTFIPEITYFRPKTFLVIED